MIKLSTSCALTLPTIAHFGTWKVRISILWCLVMCGNPQCRWKYRDNWHTSLSVPTSNTTGRHCCGGTPPIAVYSANFPAGIPMPHAPRSPNPRILSPSVMTTAYMQTTSNIIPRPIHYNVCTSTTWHRSQYPLYCSFRKQNDRKELL